MKVSFYQILFFLLMSFSVAAQEESTVAIQGRRYGEINIEKLEKYNSRLKNQQERMLRKLCRKEQKLTRKVKNKDSAAHAALSAQPLTYDSISRLYKPDSAALAKKSRRRNKAIDSLKAIQLFINNQSDSSPTTNTQFDNLQKDLNYRSYINDLVEERAKNIKSIGNKGDNSRRAFTAVEKNVFYGRQKIKALKDIVDEPSKVEEKAFEYLEGTEGFENAMDGIGQSSRSMHGMPNNTSSSELEKMGFQTKQQVQNSLKEKFGSNLSGVSQKTGNQIKQFSDKGEAIAKKVKEGENNISDSKKIIKDVKSTDRPSFNINPMRGRLFRQRIEKQYNWQTTRATIENPALLEASVLAGFKHTPSLTYGLGLATSVGLGSGWSKVKISFEGIGLRSYIHWQWQYGIGAYAGYERMFKCDALANTKQTSPESFSPSVHNTGHYSESIVLGLTKQYNINTKYNGAVQVLFDVWWKAKGLRSPVVLRFSTQTK